MRRKILFVDDDPILRKAVEPKLTSQREHFIPVFAVDGFEAVKALQASPFSLVVCDLMMPRMDGISLINHTREHYPDIPVIAISGTPEIKMRELAASLTILHYFSKPFDLEDLLTTILSTLRREAEGGIMYDVSPAVFLQFVEMDARTCSIRVLDKSGRHGGMLSFINGELVDVRLDNLRGMDAALRFFTWETATLFLRNDCQPRPNTINSSLQPIIMKAAGMRDEEESPEEEFDDDEEDDEGGEGKDGGGDVVRLLEKQIGHFCQPEEVETGASLEASVEQLRTLARDAGLGDFLFGRFSEAPHERVLVPGPPTVMVRLPPAVAERLGTLLIRHQEKSGPAD